MQLYMGKSNDSQYHVVMNYDVCTYLYYAHKHEHCLPVTLCPGLIVLIS